MMHTSLIKAALFGMSALALSACTYSTYGAGDARSVEGEGLVASRDVDVPGDASFEGMMVGVDGRVGRDLNMEGASVRGNVDVGRDLNAEGARVRFRGSVGRNADIAAATAELRAQIEGRLEIAGARMTIDGYVRGSTEIDGARMMLDGEFMGPIEVYGAGSDDGSGRAILSGSFLDGGLFCATYIDIERSAVFEGDFRFVSEDRPDNLPSNGSYEALDGRICQDMFNR